MQRYGFPSVSWDEAVAPLQLDESRRRRLEQLRAEAPGHLPGFVEALAGLGVWVAAIFFVAALAVGGWVDDGLAAVTVGLPLIAFALVGHWLLGRQDALDGKLELFRHLAGATSLAGQILVAGGLSINLDQNQTALLLSGIYLGLLFLDPSRMQAFVSSAALAGLTFFHFQTIPNLRFDLMGIACLILIGLAGRLPRLPLELSPAGRRRAAAQGAFTVLVGILALGIPRAMDDTEAGLPLNMVLALIGWLGLHAVRHGIPSRLLACLALLLPVLAVLFQTAPGILTAFLVIGWGWWSRSLRTVVLGGALLLLFLSRFYYSLDLALLGKAAMAGITAVILLTLGFILGVKPRGRSASESPARDRRRALLFAAGLVVALLVPATWVVQHESLLRRGEPMILELAPVDPRSLMQGDYMRLAYAIEREARQDSRDWPDRGRLVVQADGSGVSRFKRLHAPDQSLRDGERLLQYRRRDGLVQLGFGTFLFEEGRGEQLAAAEFAELRVDASGRGILVDLLDAQQRSLNVSEP